MSTFESHFQFGIYNDQIDCVTMGPHLGPLFANVFMSDFERKYFETLKKIGVRAWFRYVDDIFATLNSWEQASYTSIFESSTY